MHSRLDRRLVRQQQLALLFFILLGAVYFLLFAGLGHTPLYHIAGGHNDRFFSADDVYYVNQIYGLPMDTSPQIIKHPLLAAFGSLFTLVEQTIFGSIAPVRHYRLIVLAQMLASLLSTFYLYRILQKPFRLALAPTLLLCGVYAFAMSTLFYTYIAESYIWSSLLLLMTCYYAPRDKWYVTVALGALAAGVTITNAVLWAIIVLLSGRGLRERLLTLLGGGLLFCLLVAALPIRGLFFQNILTGGLSSAQNYSDHYGLFETIRRVFFAFFGSTVFYIHTASCSPFGDFPGDALSFLPSAPWPMVVMGLVWLGLVVWAAVKCRRDRRLWAPLGVLACNLLLHGVVQYGLKEAFLYSLHHLSAQILMVALLFADGQRGARRAGRVTLGLVGACLAAQLVLNLPGYRAMVDFVSR